MKKSMADPWMDDSETVGEVGESAILDVFVSSDSAPWLPVPNGDDAAVFDPGQNLVALSVDAVLEGQHFKRQWLSPAQLGARAFYVSASDLAAMGVVPKWCLVSAQLPADLSFSSLRSLALGLRGVCDSENVTVIGGNLAQAEPLALHITVGGFARSDRHTLTRSGARAGDLLWLTGSPGRAAAGRWLLDSSLCDELRASTLIDAWRRPPERWSVMSRLSAESELHAAMDLSDGLAVDSGRMAAASGKVFTLDLDALPQCPSLTWAANKAGMDPLEWVLSGGEDYEVLFAAPGPLPKWALDEGVFCVGRVEGGEAGVQFMKDERPWKPGAATGGWDPFT